MTSTTAKRPIYEIELIGNIKISVWKRTSRDGSKTFYNYGPSRGYKTESGQWKNSSTFSVEEWNAITPALEQARQHVEARKAADARTQAEAELDDEEDMGLSPGSPNTSWRASCTTITKPRPCG